MVAEVASIEVTLRLLGVDRYQADLRGAGSITEQTGARVTRSMDGITGSTQRLVRSSEGLARMEPALSRVGVSAIRTEASVTALAKATSLLSASVGGLAAGASANALKNYADAATNIQNRLAVVVPIQAQRAQVEEEIYKTAQRSRASYEDTAKIFSRMSLSASELGANQAQVLRVVETTQKALQAGGATTAESASIATQLSQALGSGRLQGDELRSISENSPVLFQAIAREFGVATGRLKELGSEGKLTSERVFRAILKAGDEVDEVFARTKPTIAAGIQQIDNALIRYIGNVDKSVGATNTLVRGLEYVAKNLDTIGDGAGLVLAGVAGSLLGRGAGKAATAVKTPFVQARASADERVQDALKAQKAAEARLDSARDDFLQKRLAYDIMRGNPLEATADARKVAELKKADKALEGSREILRIETEKLAKAEEHLNKVGQEGVQAPKALLNSETAAARAVSNRQGTVAERTMDYVNAGGRVMTAEGALPKAQAEAYAKAQAQRLADQARIAEIDAANRAAAAQVEALSRPAAGPITAKRAARVAALDAEIAESVAGRNRLGLALRQAEAAANVQEGALAVANTAARTKHVTDLTRLGDDLVKAESEVVAKRQAVAEKAAKITGFGPSGKAISADTVLKQIEEEIKAQERLATATGKRDELSARYLAMMERGPSGGSLQPAQVRELNAARYARDAMVRELAEVDAQIAAKRSERDSVGSRLGAGGRKKLGADAANAAQVAELNAGIAAASTEREAAAARIEKANGVIEAAEKELGVRTAAAREAAAVKAEAAAGALRKVQDELNKDLANLATRRKAIIDDEVANESDRARRLAAIDAQVQQRRKSIADIGTSIKGFETGAARSRESLELNAKGKISDAAAVAADADLAIATARKGADEAVKGVEKAQRAASTIAVLQGAATRSLGALSSLVGMLGGPFGAALTLASVGLVGYELYQVRAAAAVEEHAAALGRLSARLVEMRNQQAQGQKRSDREAAADVAESQDARASVVDKRNALLTSFRKAEFKADQASDLGGGIRVESPLDKASAALGVNLSKVLSDLRRFPAESEESIRAAQQLADVLATTGTQDAGYSRFSRELTKLADDYATAARSANEFEAARKQAATNKVDPGFKPATDDIGATIDAAASAGRDVADAFSQNLGERIQTGTELTDAITKQGEDAKTAFERSLGDIDTETLRNALTAVGSNLDDVKKNLDGTKIATGEAAAASLAMAKALELLGEARPDLSAVIAQAQQLANAYRQAIGLQQIAGNTALSGEDKIAAEAKLREASTKRLDDALQRQDKTREGRLVRARRDYPLVGDDRLGKLLDAEDGNKSQSRPRKSQEQRDADKLERKLRELDQDARVSALDTFDQKTVRFAQDAKVASDQIEAFIVAARSGNLSDIPPVMQGIYEKMKLLEGVKLARSALDELFPARKLARELEELRAAADASPEIAANIGLIEMQIRANNAPEFAKGLSSAFNDMTKSVLNGTATMADALETFKKKIVDLALDAAFSPLQKMLSSVFSSAFSFGGAGGLGGGSPTGGVSLLGPGFATGVTALGVIEGPGTGTSDSILARVSKGETILTAEETRRHMPAIRAIKTDRMPRFATGVIGMATAAMPSESAIMQRAVGQASSQATEASSSQPLAVHIHGGAPKTEAKMTNGPSGPSLDVHLDEMVAGMLMNGSATRAAMKRVYGNKPMGR